MGVSQGSSQNLGNRVAIRMNDAPWQQVPRAMSVMVRRRAVACDVKGVLWRAASPVDK